jgi:hypothetical protein
MRQASTYALVNPRRLSGEVQGSASIFEMEMAQLELVVSGQMAGAVEDVGGPQEAAASMKWGPGSGEESSCEFALGYDPRRRESGSPH